MGFAKYRSSKQKKNGVCKLCDAPARGRVVITLQERKEHPERTVKDANRMTYPAIASSSATYCESCAVKVYEAALGNLEGPR